MKSSDLIDGLRISQVCYPSKKRIARSILFSVPFLHFRLAISARHRRV